MSKQTLCLLLMLHIQCLIKTTKIEFVKRQYLRELMPKKKPKQKKGKGIKRKEKNNNNKKKNII
jgi:hypothetical protein